MARRDYTAMRVRQDKEKHPEKYCSVKDCLWKTPQRYCPKHFHLWSFVVNFPNVARRCAEEQARDKDA
jgi:hypothetical protein